VVREIRVLGSKRGGLMMQPELNIDVPLENAEAVLQTLEENMTLHKQLD